MVTLLYLEASHMSLHFSGIWNVTWHWKSGLRVLVCCLWSDWGTCMRVNEYVSGGGVNEKHRWKEDEKKLRRKEKDNPWTGTQRVLFEGHPLWVYLAHILFISMCSEWDSGAFKQLRHVSLMKQDISRLRWLLFKAKKIKYNSIIWMNSQIPNCRLTTPQRCNTEGISVRRSQVSTWSTIIWQKSRNCSRPLPATQERKTQVVSIIYLQSLFPSRHACSSPEKAQK